MTAGTDTQYALTEEQKQHWLEHGFIKIPKCFTREASDDFTSLVWTRLGMSPTDKSTWTTEKTNMPGHNIVSVKDFAPAAWHAICELIGGEERMADWCRDWKDGFIVNLGRPEYNPTDPLDLRSLEDWHTDGDWFTHFLDSGEQALLVIPLFTDIRPRGGGTAICTDGIRLAAQKLYDHPEGTWPTLEPQGTPDLKGADRRKHWKTWARDRELTRDESFHEATGEVGDVYLLHPFMLHSASRNLLREVRIITNPPVALKEPFNFNRADGKYNLIEQKTLRELNRPEGLPEWGITAPRKLITPDRIKIQEEMKRKEMERLAEAGHLATKMDSAKVLGGYYPS